MADGDTQAALDDAYLEAIDHLYTKVPYPGQWERLETNQQASGQFAAAIKRLDAITRFPFMSILVRRILRKPNTATFTLEVRRCGEALWDGYYEYHRVGDGEYKNSEDEPRSGTGAFVQYTLNVTARDQMTGTAELQAPLGMSTLDISFTYEGTAQWQVTPSDRECLDCYWAYREAVRARMMIEAFRNEDLRATAVAEDWTASKYSEHVLELSNRLGHHVGRNTLIEAAEDAQIDWQLLSAMPDLVGVAPPWKVDLDGPMDSDLEFADAVAWVHADAPSMMHPQPEFPAVWYIDYLSRAPLAEIAEAKQLGASDGEIEEMMRQASQTVATALEEKREAYGRKRASLDALPAVVRDSVITHESSHQADWRANAVATTAASIAEEIMADPVERIARMLQETVQRASYDAIMSDLWDRGLREAEAWTAGYEALIEGVNGKCGHLDTDLIPGLGRDLVAEDEVATSIAMEAAARSVGNALDQP